MAVPKQDQTYQHFQNDTNEFINPQSAPIGHQMNYMHSAPQVVVHSGQDMGFSMEHPQVRWSWCHLVTATISLCCCQIFGLIALISAMLSYTDHKAKDFERSRHKKNVSYGFGIAAIVIGCIIWIAVIVFVSVAGVAATNAVKDAISDHDYDSNDAFGFGRDNL